jgi:hypothetical protein
MASEREWNQLMVVKYYQEEELKEENLYLYQTDKKLIKTTPINIYLYLKSPEQYIIYGDFLIF